MISFIKNLSRKKFIPLLFVLIFTVIAYCPMLGGSFKSIDDQMFIIDNPAIKDFANLAEVFTSSFCDGPYYRPLISLINMVQFHLFDLKPFFYNLTNLTLHLINSLLVFFLISLLSKSRNTALFVFFLFAIHPIQWDAVSNISSLTTLLHTLFFLSAFLFFILFREKNKKALYYPLSIISFTLALLSRELAIIFPPLLLCYIWITKKRKDKSIPAQIYEGSGCPSTSSGSLEHIRLRSVFDPESNQRVEGSQAKSKDFSTTPHDQSGSTAKSSPTGQIYPLLPFFIIAGIYLIIRKAIVHYHYAYWPSFKEAALAILTFFRAMITYLRLFIMPVGLHCDRSRAIFTSFSDPEIFVSILFFALLTISFLKNKKKLSRLSIFFVVWFLFGLAPVSQIVPVVLQPGYIASTEHFVYLPSVGLFFFIVVYVQRIAEKGIARRILSENRFYSYIFAFFTFLFIMTLQQNIYAGNQIALYRRTLRYNPENIRVNNSLGIAYAENSLFEEAKMHFKKVLKINPNDATARTNLARCLYYLGYYKEAIEEYEKVNIIERDFEAFKLGIKEAYEKIGKEYIP